MLRVRNADLFASIGYLAGSISEWRVVIQILNNGSAAAPILQLETRQQFLASFQRILDAATEMDMIATKAAASRVLDECSGWLATIRQFHTADLQRLVSHADRVVHTFSDEMRARLVFVMPARHAGLYDRPALFGDEVEDAFPSASADIAEAGKCRALGRWTACVMHVMRALEVGLEALAAHFEIPPGDNWNQSLNWIETAIRSADRKTVGRDGEQWAAEAGAHLRFVKNAWRDHAMHPRERYDEERAVAIFDNARSFMQHLAVNLAE